MLETIERLAAVTRARLSAQPNAGKPRDIEGRNIYLCSPEYMASYARRFIANGVRLVGGCCGTTPEHIRQIKVAVKRMARAGARARRRDTPCRVRCAAGVAPTAVPPVPRSRSRGWRARWRTARSCQRRADAAARAASHDDADRRRRAC